MKNGLAAFTHDAPIDGEVIEEWHHEDTVNHLKDLLALADQTIMDLHGCFPLDRVTDAQKELNEACLAIREVTGGDYGLRKIRAAAALNKFKKEAKTDG